MSQIPQRSHWGPVLVLGSLWGLSEAALGMYLRQCASTVSGSVMTGAALFFLAAAWAVSPRLRTAAVMVGMAAGFKLFDALLLGLPVLHGAIGNPDLRHRHGGSGLRPYRQRRQQVHRREARRSGPRRRPRRRSSRSTSFRSSSIATGVAPCVTGTSYPLSLYYAPIAIGLSVLTVPLGLRAGAAPGRVRGPRLAAPLALAGGGGSFARRSGPPETPLVPYVRKGDRHGEKARQEDSWRRQPPGFHQGHGHGRPGDGRPAAPSADRRSPQGRAASRSMTRKTIALTVNGKKVSLEVEANETLLDVLRDKLDLTGAKKVCDRGECGGCTVHPRRRARLRLHGPRHPRRRPERSKRSKAWPRATSSTRSRRPSSSRTAISAASARPGSS